MNVGLVGGRWRSGGGKAPWTDEGNDDSLDIEYGCSSYPLPSEMAESLPGLRPVGGMHT